MYLSSAHSFGSIGMKLGMATSTVTYKIYRYEEKKIDIYPKESWSDKIKLSWASQVYQEMKETNSETNKHKNA